MGQPYKFQGEKDGVASASIIDMIGPDLSLDEVLDILSKALQLNGKNEWERKMASEISTFSSQFNKIVAAVKGANGKAFAKELPSLNEFAAAERAKAEAARADESAAKEKAS